MSSQTLLIELLTEELPPKVLNQLGNSFADSIVEQLEKLQLIENHHDYTAYATPRRLAVQVQNVKSKQAEQQVLRKGPAVKSALQEDGQPSKALEGFARSCGVKIAALKQIHDGKQEVFAYEYIQAGQELADLLSEILVYAVKKLPIPKVMRWGSSTYTFVRPVHGLLVLHGEKVVNASVLGLTARNYTLGHRFLSHGDIVFNHADEYVEKLEQVGKVIPLFSKRRDMILTQLDHAAKELMAQVVADDALINEVTALVEWPVVLEAGFEEHFLSVPQECLILTMQQNQKYFPLLDSAGKLINRFLLVSNLASQDPNAIIHGNERVLRARLADAEFFFIQDKKTTLASRLPKLEKVVYHNKIGSQAQRVQRLISISKQLAVDLNTDQQLTERAALLAKADLLTDMVGEFPELQGIMGRYYAIHDKENEQVANAIAEHYQPRFAKDTLPEHPISIAVSLADKLESLVGIWGIGLIPSGDKDPYALRRAALGIIRMLIKHHLDLKKILHITFASFDKDLLNPNTLLQVFEFIQTRLAILLANDYSQDVIAAVLAHQPNYLDNIVAKLDAVTQFKDLSAAKTLIAANKRVHNLLKKSAWASYAVETNLLNEDAEKELYDEIQLLAPRVSSAIEKQDFNQALTVLAGIKDKVDHFFDSVMVMVDDEAIKNNRLSLLSVLSQQLNAVADISLLGE